MLSAVGIRVINGNERTEDGWPLVDQGSCRWVIVPGSSVTLQIQDGQPAAALGAWAADWNAYVEQLEDATSACWTEGNSVLGGFGENNGSNHLGGTACDLDWEKHPMGPHAPDDPRAGFTPEQVATINEMKAFYTFNGLQIIWWANDWNTPHDSMHSQMGYGTYQDPRTQQFIDQFIRPDGFSTFRRGDVPQAVTVLAAAIGRSAATCATILPTLSHGLQLADCTTVNRIAMFIAQTRHESDNYMTTVEYGTGQRYAPYIGRTWIQITWESNYAAFGKWCVQRGLISDPDQFVNNPESLADMQWAGVGAAWFWLAPHGGHNPINDDSDAGDVRAVTYTINGGYTDLDKRIAYFNQALAQGDALLSLLNPREDDEMGAVDGGSTSIYRTDDTNIGACNPVTRANNAMIHERSVEYLAQAGLPWEAGLLAALEAGHLPASDQPGAAERATFLLDHVVPAAVAAAARKAATS